MKKFMALCLVALMVISVLPASIFAAAEPTSGKLEGTLSIKGSLRDGEVLSADLSKVKPEGIAQDQLKYEWFRIGTDGKSKSVGTGVSYALKTEDVGSSFQLTVSGKEGASVAGSLSTGKMGPVTEDSLCNRHDTGCGDDSVSRADECPGNSGRPVCSGKSLGEHIHDADSAGGVRQYIPYSGNGFGERCLNAYAGVCARDCERNR
ncbi:MAG: hypothetical protein ACLRVB_12670 [Blautia sp.]